MPSPSAQGLQRLKIVPSPVIGREICSAAPATVTSPPWWNDIRALPFWSKSQAKTRQLAALTRQVRKLPSSLQRSLTWDRGLQMGQTQELHRGHQGERLFL